MMEKKKIFIVDDHPIFRWGLCELINQEEDMQVCGGAENATSALKLIEKLKPDMVIADITLKEGNGIDLTKDINRLNISVPVLVLSMHDEFLYAERALHAGARGYIMKEQAMETVVAAIRHVFEGKICLNDDIKEHILNHMAERPKSLEKSPIERLTNRELEVFNLIGDGLSTREIAGKLNLGVKTIGTYRERIKEKLNLKHANELLRHAVNLRQS